MKDEIMVIPALSDNYIFLAAANGYAVLFDPGDAAPALRKLKENRLSLAAVVITHRHADHIGGVAEILQAYPDSILYAPAGCGLATAQIVADGDKLSLLDGALNLRVMATPGHTAEHVTYVGDGDVFCGDTVFACGCGRVLDGTMAQMFASVQKIAALPDNPMIYCGHEYTANNIRFALAVEPDNEALQRRHMETAKKRADDLPTVPFSLADERACNPFFRLRESAVKAAAENWAGRELPDDEAVFTALRRWKDSF